jgi:hypothetical protein
MISTASFFIWIAGFVFFIWTIGAAWHHWWWVKDGRPTLSQSEQLEVDTLRAERLTKTAARREVIKKRQSDLVTEMIAIRETEDLLFNPDREAELRDLLAEQIEKRP